MRFPFVALRLPDVLGEREVPSSRHYAYQVSHMICSGAPTLQMLWFAHIVPLPLAFSRFLCPLFASAVFRSS